MLRIFNILANQLDFHEVVLLNQKGGTLYKEIVNKLTGHKIHENIGPSEHLAHMDQKPLVLTSVPSYLETVASSSHTTVKEVKTFPGSLLNIAAHKNFQSYLSNTFNQKRRSHFVKCQNMLDKCFDIKHKVFYGDMEKDEYENIFNAFKEMQADRFKQKGIKDDAEDMWPTYHRNTLELVHNKNACISVIYNESKPIAISLNYILGKVVYGFTKTFDIAYAKFGLGNVELLKIIEWSFDQGFEALDFMKGEYEYKNRFTDTPYPFLVQVIYSKKNTKQRIWGISIYLGLRFFYLIYHTMRFLRLHKSKKGPKQPTAQDHIEHQKIPMDRLSMELYEVKVKLNEIKNKQFQKAICDYCYLQGEPLKSISLYTGQQNEDYIKMIASSEALIFTKVQFNAART